MLPHGPLAAGFLTGNFDVVSVSAAASTGIMDLRTCKWSRFMLDALSDPKLRQLAWKQLPPIVDANEPLGELLPSAQTLRPHRSAQARPLLFPTSDDQQAGLVGGGAVDAGQMAIILGNSAVVNSSSSKLPSSGTLDAMRLNWGPYLWMRCYNNGAQFLDRVVGAAAGLGALERAARACPPARTVTTVLPFIAPEPSLGVSKPRLEWIPERADGAGQKVPRLAGSAGVPDRAGRARTRGGGTEDHAHHGVRRHRAERVDVRDPGDGAGATAGALAIVGRAGSGRGRDGAGRLRVLLSESKRNIETPYTVADAVAQLVKFRSPGRAEPAWQQAYREGLRAFEQYLEASF